MSQLPLISIITPSYNQGKYIEETILSIINQDYPYIEYIIIDGGSIDSTIEIIKKYSNRITYWISEKDSGQANAINKGFQKATGDIINWINSDDQLMPGALKKIAQKFAENPGAILVHGRIEYFGEIKNHYSQNLPSKDLETRYAAHICMPQPASFYRRRLLDEQGLLDESLHFSMDTDLFIRAGLHYPIVQVEDVFARFRLHKESKSVSSFSKNFLSDNAVIFSRVLVTLGDVKGIEVLKRLGLYTDPAYLYKKPVKEFDKKRLLFYFLVHRLSTLYFQGQKREFKKVFNYLFKHHTGLLLSNKKLLIYRISLFLPPHFLHTLAVKKNSV
ncbi:MAG: glycosyltransferase family 2 protein [Bacteroidota bacterium]